MSAAAFEAIFESGNPSNKREKSSENEDRWDKLRDAERLLRNNPDLLLSDPDLLATDVGDQIRDFITLTNQPRIILDRYDDLVDSRQAMLNFFLECRATILNTLASNFGIQLSFHKNRDNRQPGQTIIDTVQLLKDSSPTHTYETRIFSALPDDVRNYLEQYMNTRKSSDGRPIRRAPLNYRDPDSFSLIRHELGVIADAINSNNDGSTILQTETLAIAFQDFIGDVQTILIHAEEAARQEQDSRAA